MNRQIIIQNLDKIETFIFYAENSIDAIDMLLYSLNLDSKDLHAKIGKSSSSKFLFLEHNGNTYATPL